MVKFFYQDEIFTDIYRCYYNEESYCTINCTITVIKCLILNCATICFCHFLELWCVYIFFYFYSWKYSVIFQIFYHTNRNRMQFLPKWTKGFIFSVCLHLLNECTPLAKLRKLIISTAKCLVPWMHLRMRQLTFSKRKVELAHKGPYNSFVDSKLQIGILLLNKLNTEITNGIQWLK